MHNYGLLPDLRSAEERRKDYVFGGETQIAAETLQPNGQWLDFLPSFESQKVNFETFSCVTFSATNCLEIMLKRKYNIDVNFSDRFTSKLSGTTSAGNSLYRVAESLRKIDGEVFQGLWTNDVLDWNTWYAEIPVEIRDKGKETLSTYLIQYEYVPEPYTPEVLKKALISAPLQITLFAYGPQDSSGVYHNADGMAPNHAVTLVGYVEGQYWIILDHYIGHETRKLAWDYRFGDAYKFNITLKGMIYKKEKTSPNVYAIINNKKVLVIDMPTLSALGATPIEEVDSLATYPDGGTFVWTERVIN